MITNCPVCGKSFDVLYPDLWRYKRGSLFLCSWSCLRRMERGETDMEKFTKEQRKEAIRIALDGGDVKGYLKSIGSTAPDNLWYYMKTQLRKNDPETWEKLKKLPGKKVTAKPIAAKQICGLCPPPAEVETPEGEFTPATVKVDGPIRIETPEKIYDIPAKQIFQIPEPPKPAMEYRVTGISTPIGDWQYFKKNGYLDWTPLDGCGTVSMNLDEWKELLKVLPIVAGVLGVEL